MWASRYLRAPLVLSFITLAQQVHKIVRHLFLCDIVIHAAQLAADRALARPDRPGLFGGLFFSHVHFPLLRHICSRHFLVRQRPEKPGNPPYFDVSAPYQFPSQGSKRTDFVMVPAG